MTDERTVLRVEPFEDYTIDDETWEYWTDRFADKTGKPMEAETLDVYRQALGEAGIGGLAFGHAAYALFKTMRFYPTVEEIVEAANLHYAAARAAQQTPIDPPTVIAPTDRGRFIAPRFRQRTIEDADGTVVSTAPWTQQATCGQCGAEFKQFQITKEWLALIPKLAANIAVKEIPGGKVPVFCPSCERKFMHGRPA